MLFSFRKLWIHIFLLIQVFFLIISADPILQNLVISTENSIIYDNNNVKTYYDYRSQQKYSCLVPNVLEDSFDIPNRIFEIENKMACSDCIQQFTLTYVEFSIEDNKNLLSLQSNFTSPLTLSVGESIKIQVDYFCNEDEKAFDWSLISIKLKFLENFDQISFNYIKKCGENYKSANKFDVSYIIIAAISIIIVGFASRFNRFSIEKPFKKLEFSWIFAFIYFIAGSIVLLLVYFFWDVSIIIFIIIFGILTWIALLVAFFELGKFLPIFFQFKLKIPFPCFKKMTLGVLLISFISLAITIVWGIFRNYILNDICAFGIIICLLKLFQIKSLEKSCFITIFAMLFELLWGFIFNYGLRNSYNIFFMSEFCLPLRAAIPTFHNFLYEKCTWILISSLFFPGLALSYLHKFDKSKNIHIYFRVGNAAYAIGGAIWCIITSLVDQTIPLYFFGYPLIIIFCIIVSYLRNEHTELWNGSFYEGISLNNSQDEPNSNIKSAKSLTSNYNQEEIFDGLLSKQTSKKDSDFDKYHLQKSNNEKSGEL